MELRVLRKMYQDGNMALRKIIMKKKIILVFDVRVQRMFYLEIRLNWMFSEVHGSKIKKHHLATLMVEFF